MGGPRADRWFAALQRRREPPRKDATTSSSPRTGSTSASRRSATASSSTSAPRPGRSSPRRRSEPVGSRACGSRGARRPHGRRGEADGGSRKLVASYTTTYGGEANRLHNVRLVVAQLVDNHLIAPGAEFSFNRTTGERTAEKGFREAPVIINGELQTGLGGGVCQVSTTVFNAAYDAGLPITARTNHSLYISHYPTGRDATVNYPDLDLKFVNDTRHWLLLRTLRRLVVAHRRALRHAVNRRVETETAALRSRRSRPSGGCPTRRVLVETARRGLRRARPHDERAPPRLLGLGEAAPRHHLVVVLRAEPRSSASARSRGPSRSRRLRRRRPPTRNAPPPRRSRRPPPTRPPPPPPPARPTRPPPRDRLGEERGDAGRPQRASRRRRRARSSRRRAARRRADDVLEPEAGAAHVDGSVLRPRAGRRSAPARGSGRSASTVRRVDAAPRSAG